MTAFLLMYRYKIVGDKREDRKNYFVPKILSPASPKPGTI